MSDDRHGQSVAGPGGATLFWGVFWGTIVVFALLYVFAQIQATRFSTDEQGRVLVSEAFFRDWSAALPEFLSDMTQEIDVAGGEIDQVIARRMDEVFEPVYGQIPVFLDFHYSLIGEYTELASAVSQQAGAELTRILFTEVGFDRRLSDGVAAIGNEGDAILSDVLIKLRRDLQERFALDESEVEILSGVVTLTMADAQKRFGGSDLMLKGAGAAVGAGAVAAVVAKTVGQKMTAKLMVKAAGKTAVKTAGIGGGSATGAAIGLVCGPAAWICVPVAAVAAGTAAWLATDKVVIEADEYLNRESFEAQIRAAIDDEKVRIGAKLSQIYQQRLGVILKDNEVKLKDIKTRELIEGGL